MTTTGGARSRAQPVRPVRHRDRRAGHPFHPPALGQSRCATADHHARLARLGGRVHQGDRTADRGLPRGVPVAAGLRVLRQAELDGLVDREDRAKRGTTLMARFGYERYGAQGGDWGAAVTTQIGRNGGEAAGGDIVHAITSTCRWPSRAESLRQSHAGGEGRARGGGVLRDVGHRLLQAAVHSPADPRLRIGRLPGGPAGLDRGEVLGVDRLRRASRERADPGRDARQRDDLLGHQCRDLLGPPVLGELPVLRSPRARSSCPPG